MDHARSDDPAVQRQLDRLATLSPGRDILGLERITALLAALGNPHLRLPPVFHVAGTNGKGSTCAVLRAALEGAGYRVHAFTSPHLVHFNERIRIAGKLIDDATLAEYLGRVLDIAEPVSPSFFEVTAAAAFLAFADHPADACIIEVGLGGRLDATNVIPHPAACGIAQLGVDHEAFLGNDPVGIAREKAGIARTGRPLVTMEYPREIQEGVAEVTNGVGGDLRRAGREWHFMRHDHGIRVVTEGRSIDASLPALPGEHQIGNAALALAMLMQQTIVPVSDAALAAAPGKASWSARLQTLNYGPLIKPLAGRAVLLDGGHNRDGAIALARHLGGKGDTLVILGMLANKDAAGWIAEMAPSMRGMIAIPVPDHDYHAPEELARMAEAAGVPAATASDVGEAVSMAANAPANRILIAGSLYLAGDVLRRNAQYPD
jgi:dihydrofolate synthase/folylpolyglutamate synthase